ncbi:MAG: hypothetical protein CMP38_07345, partial [Rickettsiales bacterium]|nr:hypothetical protein [Rickettsiales bacterium]
MLCLKADINYYNCFELIADGGIIVTGSHNPKDHNGFKIVLNNKP